MDSLENERSQKATQSALVEAGRDSWNKPLPEKLPRPTYWPFIVSLGIMMMAMGVVTDFAVTIVGFFLFIIAIAGWIGELQHGEE
jgi:hypothetical protein